MPGAKASLAVLAPGATVPSTPGSGEPDVHVMGPAGEGAGGSTEPPNLVQDDRPPSYAGPPPPSTTEIPQVIAPVQSQGGTNSGATVQNPDVYSSQPPAPPPQIERQLQSLQQFIEQGDNSSPIGVVLREDRREADDGTEVAGLLVVGVIPGSPAAKAGLRGYHTTTHSVLESAAVAASLFFPPAIIAVAVVDGSRVGESYDMIIGVDSARVTDFLDFSDHIRQAQPGEVVYLNVLRDGKRVQIPVKLPPAPVSSNASAASNSTEP